MRRAWRRTPLRLRLTSAVLILAALGLAVTGVFGARLLRGYLLDRLDQQLDAVARAVTERMPGDPRQLGVVPGAYHVTLLDESGHTLMEAPSAITSSAPDVPELRPAQTAARGNKPFTVDAVHGSGSWRVVALPAVDRDTGAVVGTFVLGTSLDEVDRTVNKLVHIDLIVAWPC